MEIRDPAIDTCVTAALELIKAQERVKVLEQSLNTTLRMYALSDTEWRIYEARIDQATKAYGRVV